MALLSACGGVQFDLSEEIPAQTVPGSPLAGLLPSFIPTPFTLKMDIRRETEARGTGPASAAFLKDVRLTVQAPASGTFDFIDEVHLFVTAAGLAQVEVAKVVQPSKGTRVLVFEVTPNVNLLPYVNAGAQMSASATGQQPAADTRFDGVVTVTVKI